MLNVCVEGEGGGGVGGTTPESYWCASGFRGDDVWQQNGEGLTAFVDFAFSSLYFAV